MIPLKCGDEPADFDAKVRQRGLAAIDEMVGRAPRVSHPGPRRKKIANDEADIPSERFPPFWRDALPEMLNVYERRCAFLALYFEHAIGNPSVDHMLPKSRAWKQMYEWSNYRLCAALINARKSDLTDIIDPFSCGSGWFALELVGFQVIPRRKSPARRSSEMEATLELLNIPECCKAREEYVTCYEKGHICISYLERRAPFVAGELRRQRRLRVGDV